MEGWTMIFSLKDEGLLHRIPPSRRLFPLLLAVPFVGFLAGCSEPDQTNARNAATNTTASIQMPPAIVASHTSRCVGEIGRAHVLTPVTNAHLVCRFLLEKKNKT